MNKYLRNIILLAALALSPIVAFALGYPPELLINTAKMHLDNDLKSSNHNDYEIIAPILDAPVEQRNCNTTPRVTIQKSGYQGNAISAEVRCEGQQHWTVHIPFRLRLYSNVVVARRHIKRSSILSADDLELSRRDTTLLSYGYLTDIDGIVGKKVKKDITNQSIIIPNQIDDAEVIQRGDSVTILHEYNGLVVKANGIALSGAQAGKRIMVKNAATNRILAAIAVKYGEVKL